MCGGPGKDHDNYKHGLFVGGIRADDFRMQVRSVSACIKLLHEVKNSLLLSSVTYCGAVQCSNSSDTVCRVCSQDTELSTAVTGCSMLNVTGKGVIHGEIHRQRRTPNGFLTVTGYS